MAEIRMRLEEYAEWGGGLAAAFFAGLKASYSLGRILQRFDVLEKRWTEDVDSIHERLSALEKKL